MKSTALLQLIQQRTANTTLAGSKLARWRLIWYANGVRGKASLAQLMDFLFGTPFRDLHVHAAEYHTMLTILPYLSSYISTCGSHFPIYFTHFSCYFLFLNTLFFLRFLVDVLLPKA